MKRTLISMALAACLPTAFAADIEAGRAKVQSVCAACHGVNGISVSDSIPNLAGQKATYLESQLKALKDGSRKNPVMAAIAGQLTAVEMADVAAYFATQTGASGSAKSDFLPNLAKTGVAFPEGYQASFTKYLTIDFPATKQVRYYYANPVAVAAARDGKPVPDGAMMFAEVHAARLDADGKPLSGADGHFMPEKLLFYTAMAREAGWGRDIPEMLRNENWNYAVFTAVCGV